LRRVAVRGAGVQPGGDGRGDGRGPPPRRLRVPPAGVPGRARPGRGGRGAPRGAGVARRPPAARLTLREAAWYGAPLSTSRPSLSIFFPAYNDAGTSASLALVAHMTARRLTDDHELIVVDDGSADQPGMLLDEMAAHFPWLKVVHHPANRGYGGALRTGFATAGKELVFYTDGDAQYDPRELVKLYEAFSPGVDFVNG